MPALGAAHLARYCRRRIENVNEINCDEQGKMVEPTSNRLALLFQATGIKPMVAPKLTPF